MCAAGPRNLQQVAGAGHESLQLLYGVGVAEGGALSILDSFVP